jgi:uncharacterized membrane protein (DUF485 family)
LRKQSRHNCCYSLSTVILSSSFLLLINKTIANTVYTQLLLLTAYCHIILQAPVTNKKTTPNTFYIQLLLLSAYCHIVLQAPVTNKQNNSKNNLYTTVASICLLSYYPPASCCYFMPTVILPSRLLPLVNKIIAKTVYTHLLLLSAYSHIILQLPVATLCLLLHYPPGSCCYSLPTVILSSRLLLLINKTITNTVYTQLLLLTAYCNNILQPPVATLCLL